jgi:hypothetical protein
VWVILVIPAIPACLVRADFVAKVIDGFRSK